MSPVFEGLRRNEDYRRYPEAQAFFELIVWVAIRFVISRYNMTRETFPTVAYLFNRDKSKPPLEKELQQDFHAFLLGTFLAGQTRAEARDLAGGRVDILFDTGLDENDVRTQALVSEEEID